MYAAKRISHDQAQSLEVSSPLWERAQRSPRFVNIVNGRPATLGTEAAVLWSDEHLFVRYWAEEPFLAGTFTERDSLLFSENNVELFIDGADGYYELEISANNVVYEVLFAWKDNFATTVAEWPELEPVRANAYTFGGNNDRDDSSFWKGTHPRGTRWAYPQWDMPGLETQVRLDGTINDHCDVDDGWHVMIKIPWASLRILANGRSLPPHSGDVWRFQFARYELIQELDTNVGWAWTPVGDRDNHEPEKFTPVRFVPEGIG